VIAEADIDKWLSRSGSDQEALWSSNASGANGRRAQLKELERQLRYLPVWLARHKETAMKKKKRLKKKIAKLKKY
jgi:hypothetical protein